MKQKRTNTDDDAVSITTGYILHLGIGTTAIGLMLLLMGGTFADFQSFGEETELRIAGEDTISELQKADRLQKKGYSGEIYYVPPEIGGDYQVIIPDPDSDNKLYINNGDMNITFKYNVESFDQGGGVSFSSTRDRVIIKIDSSGVRLDV